MHTNPCNTITIELIQVFIITAPCFKENHTYVDTLGMIFAILHVAIPSCSPIKPYPRS